MSQPDGDATGTPPAGDPLSRFLDGLSDQFAAYRPQGSAAWNFAAAFSRLEEAWGRTFAADRARSQGAEPPAPAPDGSRSLTQRVAGRLTRPRDEPNPGAGAGADAGRAEEGFDATLEALRFLAARVDRLESEAAVRAHPVEGMAWLEEDDASVPLAAPIAAELAGAALAGGVLHVECGRGDLLERLRDAGIEARGADPRGALALDAARRGLDAGMGEALTTLADSAPASRGAVVLSGVVDREPLTRQVALLGAALGALAPGGVLVVASQGPGAVAGWAAVAQDLLPGRPLHAETWELLAHRAGCEVVGRLGEATANGDGPPGAYAVVARKPR